MPAPIITYYDATDTTKLTQITFGPTGGQGAAVKAGTESAVQTFHIWNDKDNTGGPSSVATAVDITTKDTGAATALVTDRWCQMKTEAEQTWTAVGDATIKSNLPNIAPQSFISMQAKMVVPGNAAAQTYSFLIRVSYSYT